MKPEHIGDGNKCPKCSAQMRRFQHKKMWAPGDKQPYYFKYWDKCPGCRRIQLYEIAKVFCEPINSPAS